MTPQERTDAQIAIAIRDWLEQGVDALPDGMDLPRPVRDQIVTQLPTTPQRRRWWSGRWSTRGHGATRGDDVPGDRESRRSRGMHGFAALLAAGAIGGAALLAGVSQQETAPPGPRTIVVAQDGSGDATTITEGVALAVDGDTVLVRPGAYQESVVITTDITLAGDGPREEVIIEGTAGLANITDIQGPYSLVLRESDATLEGLTIRGMAGMVVVVGGAPVLQDLSFENTGIPYGSSDPCTDDRGCGSTFLITGGSTATVRDSSFVGGADLIVDGQSDPLIERNELRDGPLFYLAAPGDLAVVRDKTISGTIDRAIGIFDPSTMLIEGNQISDAGGDGITVGWDLSIGVDPVIRANTIRSSAGTGISVRTQAKPTIEGNVLEDNNPGVMLIRSDALVSGNQIRGPEAIGIAAPVGGAPVIRGNVLENNAQAIVTSLSTADGAVISDNTLCGNGVDYRRDGDVTPLPEGNTTCAPASGAPSAAP